jgi:prepilin-type N-terminal cleavage/methylation domain-containing protein/prepilin-type processing-associated H-X9-DG protein
MHPRIHPARHGFSLLEIIAAVAICVILALLVISSASTFLRRSKESVTINNLRQIGLGVSSYASENDGSLPARIRDGDKWPVSLAGYLGNNPKLYADPAGTNTYLTRREDPITNLKNYTSFVFNGFNDLGTFNNQNIAPRAAAIGQPSQTILMTIQDYHPDNFYMDFDAMEHLSMLAPSRYHGGSYYLFADGSVRFLGAAEYDHRLWLINKDFPIP